MTTFIYGAVFGAVVAIGLGISCLNRSLPISHSEIYHVRSKAKQEILVETNNISNNYGSTNKINNPAVKMFNINMLEQVLMMPRGK